MRTQTAPRSQTWPTLPLEAWNETYATLHLWTQIVGKIRLAQSPWVNHGWHVTLYVTARGLTTSPIPHGSRTFQIDFDFIDHQLTVRSSDGGSGGLPLRPQSVAAFYTHLMAELDALQLQVHTSRKPNEVADPLPFDRNETHRAYDPEYASRFWQILVQADRAFKKFRCRFIGKCSPRALFLGRPGPGRDAVFRTNGTAAPWRNSKPSGLGDPGSLHARSQQLRVLARGWADSLSGVLFLCLSGTGGFYQGASRAECRLLQY